MISKKRRKIWKSRSPIVQSEITCQGLPVWQKP